MAPDIKTARRRTPRVKPDAQVILLCNPRAGGRWKELARILDSEEAHHVRRIVTDSVEDVAPALGELGRATQLLCVYGGDGTIQRVLDRLSYDKHETLQLALLGGGTMNVTSRWCGMTPTPAKNFRTIVNAFRTGELLLKEVPLLEVRHGDEVHRGFTFGMGPIVRVLDAYERSRKGKVAALEMAGKAVAAAWTGRPVEFGELLRSMRATVEIGDESVGYDEFSAVFANVTGQINPGVEPFGNSRPRDEFYCAAYAVTAKELTLALPLVLRGWLPVDLMSLLQPMSFIRSLPDIYRQRALPADPRYINQTADHLEITTDERLYTLDGELLRAREGETITVRLGPMLRLAVSPEVGLSQPMRVAAQVMRGQIA